MRVSEMNWMQIRDHVADLRARDVRDRIAVLPIGSTEQHAYLSLSVDSILAERVAAEAAEPVSIPVFPVLSYGLTPNFVEFPGTVSLRVSTLCAVVEDILNGIARAGFNRIVIVNGHGGNGPAQGAVAQWLDSHADCQVKWHNWWNAPRTWAQVTAIDDLASHASWMENFTFTRTNDPRQPVDVRKPLIDFDRLARVSPAQKMSLLGDGNFGGLYQRGEADMAALWAVAVDETRGIITDGWD